MNNQNKSKEELLGFNGLPRSREITHPGIIIKKDFLPELIKSMNKKGFDFDEQDVIDRIETYHSGFSSIINGIGNVTAESALYLSELFGCSATFWLNLQRDFDLSQAIQNVNFEHLKSFRQNYQF